MEILAAFKTPTPSARDVDRNSDISDEASRSDDNISSSFTGAPRPNPLDCLTLFRRWIEAFHVDNDRASIDLSTKRSLFQQLGIDLDESKISNEDVRTKKLLEFHEKHKNARTKWSVANNFPDAKVAEAYLYPKANRSSENFTWKQPSVEKTRSYCFTKLGWNNDEIEKQLKPVLARLATRYSQTRMDSFVMSYKDNITFAKIKSDRLLKAVVQSAGGDVRSIENSDLALISKFSPPKNNVGGKKSEIKAKEKRRERNETKSRIKSVNKDDKEESENENTASSSPVPMQPSATLAIASSQLKRPRRRACSKNICYAESTNDEILDE